MCWMHLQIVEVTDEQRCDLASKQLFDRGLVMFSWLKAPSSVSVVPACQGGNTLTCSVVSGVNELNCL